MNNNDKVLSRIAINNAKREKALSNYACKSKRGIRKNTEKYPDHGNIRTSFSRDIDRIIRSLSYTRYIDKTQVFYLFKNDHITHRVLHVQFVSKIGRTIGRCLQLNEDLIEAISLGHDLGHAPYGHDGEQILNNICETNKIGSFCHNAQSVRFLMEIEKLNLTLQVYDGILAHNGEILDKVYAPINNKTWAIFEDEYKKCLKDRDYSKQIRPMTLEGCVVRISDIIAYIGRDIEDAIRLGLIRYKDIPREIKKTLGTVNQSIVYTLITDLIKNSYGNNYLSFSDDIFKALIDLKEYNEKNIYINPKIKTETHKINRMFEMIYDECCGHLIQNKTSKQIFLYHIFMPEIKYNSDYLKIPYEKRIIIDFIAGMTDHFFNDLYNDMFVPKYYGYKLRSKKTNKSRIEGYGIAEPKIGFWARIGKVLGLIKE